MISLDAIRINLLHSSFVSGILLGHLPSLGIPYHLGYMTACSKILVLFKKVLHKSSSGDRQGKLRVVWTQNFKTGFPCFLSGKESDCQWRRHRFDPWSRKIPRAMEDLSLYATTLEPALQSPEITMTEHTCPKPSQCEACTPQGEGRPTLHNQRKACTATKTQYSQK